MSTTILNAKTGGVENKIPNTSSLMTVTVLDAKIGEVQKKFPGHDKHNTTSEFDKLAGSIFDTKLKHANLATNSDVNTVEQCTNKTKNKMEKVQTFNLSYFLSKKFSVKIVFKFYLFINQHLISYS